jgi:hypothetical protein
MIRLYLFVEGATEQTFANTVLQPHFAAYSVQLQPAVLIANSRRHGKVQRGGGRRYKPMRDDILRFTAQEKGADVRFTTMIDLYSLALDFPGLRDTEKLRHLPYERVKALEQAWYDDQPDRRFLPFIVLHEYETLLFSKPDEFSLFYPNRPKEIRALQQIATDIGNIELINDSPQTAPSKRIMAQFPAYENQKTIVGTQVAELIGLQRIRECCRHFDEWVRRIENLGKPTATDLANAQDARLSETEDFGANLYE